MRKRAVLIFFVFMSVVLVACTTPPKEIFPPAQNEPFKSIYLIGHGGHAGIVIKRADIPAVMWPENNDFPDAEYLEVGWGDKDYYQIPDPHIGIAVKAVFLPTASVLHIVGFRGSVTHFFPVNEVIKLNLSYEGFERLVIYISHSYAKDESGRSQLLGPGLYGHSRFYLSRETYHLFNTCNVWVARALQNSGLPLTPSLTITMDSLMLETRVLGTVVQASKTEAR
jgi:uncharacterized protein (TIGR02117 family)